MTTGASRHRLEDPTTWPDRAHDTLAALPDGTLELAEALLQRALSAAGDNPGAPPRRPTEAAGHLVAPVVLEPDWPPPTDPLPIAGGAVHADLTDDDHETFARLRATMTDRREPIDAESLAAEAQRWRLPVTPYRRLAARAPARASSGPQSGGSPATASPSGPEPGRRSVARPSTIRRRGRAGRPTDQPLVVDLSALWAGPLATSLIADLGARVVKIDPEVRPDALRDHPRIFQHLNGRKEIVDLDLRLDADRDRFETLLSTADLLVDSFSPRVMPNFGYGRRHLRERFPDLATLAVVAFPTNSPERDWVSYGPGVHAVSGLGSRANEQGFRAAPIAYPDAVAGLHAFAVAIELINRRGDVDRAEISLLGAIAPLVATAIERTDRDGAR